MIEDIGETQSYCTMLQKAMNYDSIEDLQNCCINILTEFSQYNFCFIEFETKTHLGVFVTCEDLKERFVLLNKKYIIDIAIVYKDDLEIDSDKDHVVSYS